MKTASLNELKKELTHWDAKEMAEVCLRLAKYKKENKEFLHYLVFESENEADYVARVKSEVEKQFGDLPIQPYMAVKGLRKILRLVTKHSKFSGSKVTEVELLIHYLSQLKKKGYRIQASGVLSKLWEVQMAKVQKSISTLHEDLQYDYREELKRI